MKDLLKNFFGSPGSTTSEQPADPKRIAVATCALFIELAKADGDFSDDERAAILSHLKGHHGVSDEVAGEILQEAAQAQKDAIDVWKFTKLIKDNYTRPQKKEVVALLWGVLHADGKVHAREEHLARRVADLLGLDHSEFIEAKMKALPPS